MEPIEIIDTSDPGDDVQLRFRYQHGYGAILAIQAILSNNDYVEFWYEQFEDILCKNTIGMYSYFQIKTRKPELGYWTLKDDALINSIKKFVSHETKFSCTSEKYCFVSNAEFMKTGDEIIDKVKIAYSPINFLQSIYSVKSYSQLTDKILERFKTLKGLCNCSSELLFNTLKKTQLILGPSISSLDTELSCTHLSKIDSLKSRKLSEIHKFRDLIMHSIFKASSLSIDTGEKHIFNVVLDKEQSHIIFAKRKSLDDFNEIIKSDCLDTDYFRFLPTNSSLNLGNSSDKIPILSKKLKKGNLDDYIENLQLRALSAEKYLIELSLKNPDEFSNILNQIENTVLTECNDILILNTDENDDVNSKKMLKEVILSMKNISDNKPKEIHYQSSNTLLGVAGLLTSECKIWWSKKFDLDKTL